MALLDGFVMRPGVPPVTIHDEGDVGGYWSRCKDIEEEVLEIGEERSK